MKSSPANGAGAPRSGPAFTRSRRSIRELSDGEALEIALIENIQRADLNALEEARGYSQLLSDSSTTRSSSSPMPWARAAATSPIRCDLLTSAGSRCARISRRGGSRPDMRAPWWRPTIPTTLAARIIEMGLRSGRPRICRAKLTPRASPPRLKPDKSPDIRALETELAESLGLTVSIADHGAKGGTVSIAYTTLEQFDEVTRRLMRGDRYS